ncbi:MAG: hypothetical protein WA655_23555 [Candidatus Korobacteraceae bacterium]
MYYLPMAELPILHSQPRHHEELILVGFRVDAQHDGPQFYTVLAVGGDNERPIAAEGRVVFFTRPELGTKALALDGSMASLGPPPQDIETFCDVAEALHLVNSQNTDPDSVVLDCLLVFDDLVRATRLHMPDRYQGLLTELAARLTERARLGDVFSSHALREHVEDALLWCVGAITAKARIISE